MTARTGQRFAVYAEFDGTPESARDARTLVRHALGDDHPQADDAALIMSELVGIAIETAEPHSVTIQVRDSGGFTTPRVQGVDADAEHGRGPAIVSALAAEWG